MSLCAELQKSIGSLFTCSEQGTDVRIRTPFMYPDGDYIDLFIDGNMVTDYGETVRWLRNQTVTSKRSDGQKRLIEDVCQTIGIDFFKGMLRSRIRDGESVAEALIRVAQGAVRVADVWFTFRARTIQTVSDDVSALLLDEHIEFQQNVSYIDRMGKSRTIDFKTWTPATSSLVLVLATGSRSAASSMIERTIAGWHLLSHLQGHAEPLQFVSLFDDTLDVWHDSDFTVLEEMSRVARWSAPAEFLNVLSTAAV